MKSTHAKALEPWQIRALQDEHRLGTSCVTLADRYGVSVRTVFRYIHARVERVYVDGWTAWFALHGDDAKPQLLTPWEQA